MSGDALRVVDEISKVMDFKTNPERSVMSSQIMPVVYAIVPRKQKNLFNLLNRIFSAFGRTHAKYGDGYVFTVSVLHRGEGG